MWHSLADFDIKTDDVALPVIDLEQRVDSIIMLAK